MRTRWNRVERRAMTHAEERKKSREEWGGQSKASVSSAAPNSTLETCRHSVMATHYRENTNVDRGHRREAERRVDEQSREQKQRKRNTLKRSARPFEISSRRQKAGQSGAPIEWGKARGWAVVHK